MHTNQHNHMQVSHLQIGMQIEELLIPYKYISVYTYTSIYTYVYI